MEEVLLKDYGKNKQAQPVMCLEERPGKSQIRCHDPRWQRGAAVEQVTRGITAGKSVICMICVACLQKNMECSSS